jgi:flagellar basal body-associated protein FliL
LRLRVRGIFLLVIIVVFACAITGTMIWRWKYEDSKAQSDIDQLIEMDADTAGHALTALPLVMRYDRLSKTNPQDTPQMDAVAQQIVTIFPEFRAPAGGPGIKLVPTEKMLYMLRYWTRNQDVTVPARP